MTWPSPEHPMVVPRYVADAIECAPPESPPIVGWAKDAYGRGAIVILADPDVEALKARMVERFNGKPKTDPYGPHGCTYRSGER